MVHAHFAKCISCFIIYRKNRHGYPDNGLCYPCRPENNVTYCINFRSICVNYASKFNKYCKKCIIYMREKFRCIDCNVICWSPNCKYIYSSSIYCKRHFFVLLWNTHVTTIFPAIAIVLKINTNFDIAIIIFKMIYGNYKFLNIDEERTYSKALGIFMSILNNIV